MKKKIIIMWNFRKIYIYISNKAKNKCVYVCVVHTTHRELKIVSLVCLGFLFLFISICWALFFASYFDSSLPSRLHEFDTHLKKFSFSGSSSSFTDRQSMYVCVWEPCKHAYIHACMRVSVLLLLQHFHLWCTQFTHTHINITYVSVCV